MGCDINVVRGEGMKRLKRCAGMQEVGWIGVDVARGGGRMMNWKINRNGGGL